jgi:hypothetical protein
MSELKEYLTLKALAFKFSVAGGYGNSYDQMQRIVASGALTNDDSSPVTEEQFDLLVEHRQTCAKLPGYIVDKMDRLCAMLEITKREFIEMAIVEALEIAEKTNAEFDIGRRLVQEDADEKLQNERGNV